MEIKSVRSDEIYKKILIAPTDKKMIFIGTS